MEMHALETVFFYRVDGELSQTVELALTLATPCAGLQVEIDAGEKGRRVTRFGPLPAGGHTLRCHAPVVYPNIVTGRHMPLSAFIAVDTGKERAKGNVVLGRHRPWTVYVCQDVCADCTWGMPDDQTKLESYRLTLKHLDEMDRTDAWTKADRNRWNMNQAMEIEWFFEQANEADKERFLRRAREGRLKLSATYNANLSSIMPPEQAIRSLYYVRELERKFGLAFDTVEHIEVPSMAWGMMEIYAGAGIRRFVKAWYEFYSHHVRKSPETPLFRWVTPSGASVLSLMPRDANLKGTYAQARFLIQKNLEGIMNELHNWWIPCYEGTDGYPYDSFALLGSYGDLHACSKNEVAALVDAISRYNAQGWEYPKLVNATWDMYFDAVEHSAVWLGVDIPSLAGDFGVSWEDWPAHYAHVAAEMKRGIAGAFALERLAAGAQALSGGADTRRKALLDEAMLTMERLAEHPWNGTNEDERWRSHEKRAGWARRLTALNGGLLESLSGNGELYLYNSLCRPRTDIACVDAADAPQGAQVICSQAFWAVDSPAMGLVRRIPSARHMSRVSAKGNMLDSDCYLIEVDPVSGAISSLLDKRNGRQWAGGCGLNALLYLSDGVPLRASCLSIEAEADGPLVAQLKVRAACPRCELETTIRLNAANDRIDIENRLQKEPSGEPANLYFAFPFDAARPEYHYESAASILRPGLAGKGGDMLPGAGQEAYAVQDFVDVNSNGTGILLSPLDSHMFQFGGNGYGLMPDGPLEGGPTVLALCLTNHAYEEMLHDQYGHRDFCFRFALKPYSGAFDEERAVCFGREANHPLMPLRPCEEFSGLAGKSLVRSLTPGVFVTALKSAEEMGGALVLRFWNAYAAEAEARFDVSTLGMRRAEIVDLLERRNDCAFGFDGKTLVLPVKGRGFGAVLLIK